MSGLPEAGQKLLAAAYSLSNTSKTVTRRVRTRRSFRRLVAPSSFRAPPLLDESLARLSIAPAHHLLKRPACRREPTDDPSQL